MSTVFVSHSSEDKDVVRRLARRIEDAGHEVWLDEEQLHIGDSLVDRIGDSLAAADFVVVALSPSSVASSWVRQELNSALSEQIESSRTKVLPVLIRSCEIPPLLRDRIYADVSHGEFEEGVDVLIATIAFHNKHAGRLPSKRSQREALVGGGYAPPSSSRARQAERLREFVHSSLQLVATRGQIYGPILDVLREAEPEMRDDYVLGALAQVTNALGEVEHVRASLERLGPNAFADHFDVYYRFAENLERRAGVLRSLSSADLDTSSQRLLQLAEELRALSAEAHGLTAELTLELLDASESDPD